MERTKNRLIPMLLLLVAGVHARADYRSDVYYAYINNKMEIWKNAISRMEAIPDKSNEQLLELINYQYGYIGYCIGSEKKDEARGYIKKAQQNIEMLETRKYRLSEINAYKSAIYGFRIGLNPLSAPVNGLKSINCAKTSLEMDPESWLGYVQQGNIMFYMPPAFGGSKTKALEYLLKAKELFEKKSGEIPGNWNYLSIMILIGQTYTNLKDYDSARKIYEQLLVREPGFKYVKDDLYPELLQKMNN